MIADGAIVLYKQKIMLAKRDGDKIKLNDSTGDTEIKVRDKDVELVFSGPVKKIPQAASGGDFETAWDMTKGTELDLSELVDLAFPPAKSIDEQAANFIACRLEAASELRFKIKSEQKIISISSEERSAEEKKQQRKAAEKEDRESFIERAKKHKLIDGDERFWGEIEALAYGRTQKSKMAQELGLGDIPEAAQKWLLKSGIWTNNINPHVIRVGHPVKAPSLDISQDSGYFQNDEHRIDLSSMEAFAIDSPWSHDPDDAISWDGQFVWVHIADPASLVLHGSAVDMEASCRASTLYVPEGSVPMLPTCLLERFCLGLTEKSRALSFKISLDASGNISDVDIHASWIKVTRLTYQDADTKLSEGVLAKLAEIATLRAALRKSNGAVNIDIPEVRVWLDSNQINITKIQSYASAKLVAEMMILVGEALARFAFSNNLPFPYYGQEAPQPMDNIPEGLAGEFAKRRLMKAGIASVHPRAHSGLGVTMYAQAGSPLRRYGDLLGHQQLRAYIYGTSKEPSITADDLSIKLGRAAAGFMALRKAERNSELHWTIAWLLEKNKWQGEAVVVQLLNNEALIFIPDIGSETKVKCSGLKLNQLVTANFMRADISKLEMQFSI